MKDLLILGCGGHSRTVIDTAKLLGRSIVGLIDLNFSGVDERILGVSVIGGSDQLANYSPDNAEVFIAIGDNEERSEVSDWVKNQGFTIISLVHPSAIVSSTVTVGKGVIVCAGCIINPMAKLADGVIVNTGSIVDHETAVGEFTHLAPGTRIAGRVSIGKHSFIGIGASVVDKVTLGDNVIVGAGSVVLHSIKDNTTVVGISKVVSP